MLYLCIVKLNEIINMKWSELTKIAVAKGFRFHKHGKKHDEYYNPDTGVKIQIERHKSQEVRPGLMNELKRIIGF